MKHNNSLKAPFLKKVPLFLLCQEGKSNRLWIELKVVDATWIYKAQGHFQGLGLSSQAGCCHQIKSRN